VQGATQVRHRFLEDRFYAARFVLDLPVREAQWSQAGGGVGLEAQGVSGLRRGSAVVAPAVGLDDEAEVGPEEVDLELVDHDFGERDRKAGPCRKWAEEAFQLVVGEDRPLDGRRPGDRRQVEEGLDRLGEGDVQVSGDCIGGQGRAAVQRTPGTRPSESRLTLTSM
jgi:hypothetical protein